MDTHDMHIIRYYCHVLRVVCAYRNRLGKHAFAYYNVWDTCISMRNRILRLGHNVSQPRLHDTTCCQSRLSNRFDNRVNVCIYDTTGCQTRCQTSCQTI